MSELDTQLAALAAAQQAQAAILIAEAKAKDNAATFTSGALTDAELNDLVTTYEAAVGTSKPHDAIGVLWALCKHLSAGLAEVRTQLAGTDTAVATGYADQQAYDAKATTTVAPSGVPYVAAPATAPYVAAPGSSTTVIGSSGTPTSSGYVGSS
jgi:hypothetical protein